MATLADHVRFIEARVQRDLRRLGFRHVLGRDVANAIGRHAGPPCLKQLVMRMSHPVVLHGRSPLQRMMRGRVRR